MKIKYISLFMAALLSASALTSCGSDSTDNSADSPAETVIASADSYDVVSVNLSNEVYYAQIKGLSDETLQTEINDQLEELEKSRHTPTKIYTAQPEVSYCDDDVLSLVQNAVFKSGTSSTILNLNMKTGEELELSDVADLDEMAEKIYTDNGVSVISGYEGASIQNYLEESHTESVEDILKDLERCHFYLDENKNPVVTLDSSSGFMDVLVK